MKKLLSSFILAAAALTAQATDYVTTLDINAGSGSKKYPKSTVQVQPNGDGTCTVTIKNVKYEYAGAASRKHRYRERSYDKRRRIYHPALCSGHRNR